MRPFAAPTSRTLAALVLTVLGLSLSASGGCGRQGDEGSPPGLEPATAESPGDDAEDEGTGASRLIAVWIDHSISMEGALRDGSPRWGSAILAVAESLSSLDARTDRIAVALARDRVASEADEAPVLGLEEDVPASSVLLETLHSRKPDGNPALLATLRDGLKRLRAYRTEHAPDSDVDVIVLASSEEDGPAADALRRAIAREVEALGSRARYHVLGLAEDADVAGAIEALGATVLRPADADALRAAMRDLVARGETRATDPLATGPASVSPAATVALSLAGVFLPTGRYDLRVGRDLDEGARILWSERDGAYLVLTDRFDFALLVLLRTRCLARVEQDALETTESDGLRVNGEVAACSLGELRMVGGGVQSQIQGTAMYLLPRPPLIGRLDAATLLRHLPEYAWRARRHAPNRAMLEEIRRSPKAVSVVVYFGTWCAFCNRYLPHCLRVEKELAGGRITFTYRGLPAPPGWHASEEAVNAGIQTLPTAVVTVDGREVGRITGTDWVQPERALARILR